jgi:hypothetical protein
MNDELKKNLVSPFLVWPMFLCELAVATGLIYDSRRDAYLESRGYRVMRFSNRLVLHKGAEVVKAIQLELARVKI